MLAEQHVFSLMWGGRTFIIDVRPKVLQCVEQYSLDSSGLVCVTTAVPQRWLGRRRAPLRCWRVTVRPPDTPSPYTRCTACLSWWRSSPPSSPAAWITASFRHWLTRSTCSTAICFTFAKFAGLVEEPCCPVCATTHLNLSTWSCRAKTF